MFANHPLVWTGGDFPTQSTGTTMAFTTTAPGLHRFHCMIHLEATGRTATRRYDQPGSVTAALRYVDDLDETSSATKHAFTVVRVAGAGPGAGGTPQPGQPGGTGGAPPLPSAPGSPSSPASGAQGAGPSEEGTTAPRLSVAARVLAFRDAQRLAPRLKLRRYFRRNAGAGPAPPGRPATSGATCAAPSSTTGSTVQAGRPGIGGVVVP
jgi:hypothetical protein